MIYLNQYIGLDIKIKNSYFNKVISNLTNELKNMKTQEVIDIIKENRHKMSNEHADYLYLLLKPLDW